MFEEEQPHSHSPKFENRDEVYLGNKLWYVYTTHSYGGLPVHYDLVKDLSYYDSNRKFKFDVPEGELHRLPLHERLARVEKALGLD